MKWYFYEDEFTEWSQAVTRIYLKQHTDKEASDTELGHVKIDNNTLIKNANGQIEVTSSILQDAKDYTDLQIANLPIGTSAVESVNGKTGVVVIDKYDIGLGNVNNTSDLDKPVSNATQTELNKKLEQSDLDGILQDITNLQSDVVTKGEVKTVNGVSPDTNGNVQITVTGGGQDLTDHINDNNNPHNVTKVQVGLSDVDNTSDLNKPISTATQLALDDKVDKVFGKQLSTEDFTTALKNKLENISESTLVWDEWNI